MMRHVLSEILMRNLRRRVLRLLGSVMMIRLHIRCNDNNKSDEKSSDNDRPHSSRQRPRVPGLQRDVEVLKSELLTFISAHGQDGFMPTRKQLRKYGRVDIEKAITRMGEFRRIASLMNLSLA